MKKQIMFIDKDKELVEQIMQYQKENKISSFIETVRQLCRSGLEKNVNVKINLK